MSKLIFITNTLTQEQVEFITEAETLSQLAKKFMLANPNWKELDSGLGYSVRVDGMKILDFKVDIPLTEDSEIVIFPDIDLPIAFLPLLMTAMSSVASATGIASMATGLSAIGMAGSGLAAGTMTVGAAASVALTGATIFVGGVLNMVAVVGAIGGAASMFSSHKPPGGAGGGEGAPGEGSPKYGWNVQPSRSDGIPIPVIYGIEKVGGNIISKSTSSTPTFAWDWFNTGDSGCALISVPLFPFSVMNVGLMGVWPPVRGYSCGVDPAVWAYLFTSIKILTYKDIKDFVAWIVNGDKPWFKTPEDYKNMMKFVTSVSFKCFKRTYWNGFFDSRVSNAFNARNKAKNIFTSTDFQNETQAQLGQRLLVNPVDADFEDYADYNLSVDFMQEIKTWMINNQNIRRERSNNKQANGLDLKMKWFIPLIHGDEFMQIFDDEASEIDNLGIYLTVAFCFSAEAASTAKWWINDVYGLTRVEHIDGMDFRLFNFKIRDTQLSYENYLHELIALGEGECAGLKALYFDDLPVQTFPGVNYFFLSGKNTDTFLHPPKNFTEMNNYNNTVVSHSDGRVLEKVGDYIDFETTVGFPANNVHIRMKFNAYRMTLKGKIDDLDDTPITFFIMVGFKGVADFATANIDDMENASISGNFIAWKYRVFGGMKDPFYRFFTSFPLANFASNVADTLINIIPGAARALAGFLGVSEFEGAPINWVKYYVDAEYALRLHQYLQSLVDSMYINNDKQIWVRILRASAHVNNNRYTDTMEVVGFDEVSFAGFDYPNLAKIGIKIRATEKLNSTEPNITAVVKGKLIWVPKLKLMIKGTWYYPAFEHCWFDEDIGKYRNCDLSLNTEYVSEFVGALCEFATIDNLPLRADCTNLDWSFEYSNNNVWCLYDILTQQRYGLGNYVDKKDLPLYWFVEAGKHCDEMVPDGTLRWASAFDGISTNTQQLIDEDSTYFETERTYWDDELNTFLSGQKPETDGNVFNETYSNKFGLVNDYHGQAVFVESPDGGMTKTWVRDYKPEINVLTATRIARLTLGADGNHPSWNYLVGGQYTRWTNGDPKVPEVGQSVKYMLARKRYTLNYVMDDSSSATDVIKQLCQTFRCFTIWTNNGIIPLLDKPELAKTVIGMGNIIKDSMSIAYKSLKDVPNILECQFSNEELHYEKDVRQVSDADIDVEYALDLMKIPRKKDVKLLGITNPAAIFDELRYRLASEKKQTEVIQFSAGIDQITLVAGQVFTFAHDIMVGVGQSGRIVEYIPSGDDDWILIDQPLPTLDDNNLKIQVTFIVGEIEIQSEYSILEVDATNRAMIRIEFGVLKPQKFMPYIIGQTGTVSKDYRAISVVPAEDLAIQIVAIEYDESVYGTVRETPLGTISYYDGTPVAAKNDRVTLLSAKSIYRPVNEADVAKGYSSTGQLTLRVTFKRPFNPLYTGCAITRKIGTGLNETLITLPANDTVFVDDTPNLPKDELITYYLVAQYVGGNFSNPVTVSILVDTDVSDSDLPYPETIKDLVLESWCRKNFGLFNSSENVFATRQLGIKWSKPGFVLPAKWDGDSQNKIECYLVEIRTYLSGSPTPHVTKLEVESYTKRVNIDYDMMGLSTKAQVDKVVRVNVAVAAVATNHMQGDFYSEDFTPDDGLGSAKEVFHMSVPGGSIIWWKKPDDALEMNGYYVELTLYNKKHPEKRVTKTTTVKHEYCFFKITDKDREALDILLFAGLVSGYSIKITPTTVWGKFKTLEGGDGDDPDTIVDGEENITIPDWMMSSSAQNIEIYDMVHSFISRPNVSSMRNELWNFTKGLQTRINLLLDGKSTTGITYSGVGVNVARIAYCTPTEGEYSSVYFNVDRPCYVWLEVLENREDGGLSEADAYYYYGSSDPANYLVGDTLLYLGSGGANLTHAVLGHAWRVNTGNNYAKFPTAVNSRHLRLVIQPISGSTVKVSEVRFCRRIIANEIITDTLSAISADMGTINAGQIRFNIASLGSWPSITLTDSRYGAMLLSSYGLAAWNNSGALTALLDTSTGYFTLGGGTTGVVNDTHKVTGALQVTGTLLVGTNDDGLLLDGAANSLYSVGSVDGYSAGEKGVFVSPSLVEAYNLKARGTLSCMTLLNDSVSSFQSFLISPSSSLEVAMGVNDTEMYITENSFVQWDVVHLQINSDKAETFLIMDSATIVGDFYKHTVTRKYGGTQGTGKTISSVSSGTGTKALFHTATAHGFVDYQQIYLWGFTGTCAVYNGGGIVRYVDSGSFYIARNTGIGALVNISYINSQSGIAIPYAATTWEKGTAVVKISNIGALTGSIRMMVDSGIPKIQLIRTQNSYNNFFGQTPVYVELASTGLVIKNGGDIQLTTSTVWGDAAIIRWKTSIGDAVGTIYCTDTLMSILYNGNSGSDYIEGSNSGLILNFIGIGGSHNATLRLVNSSITLECNHYIIGATATAVSIGHWDGVTWTSGFSFVQDESIHVAKIGFFGVTPAIRDQVSSVSATITGADPAGLWAANIALVQELKDDHNTLTNKVNEILTSLQSYGLL
jgi:hypothetical protein